MSITTPQGRYYEIGDKSLPSVTTILGILNKPVLVAWSAKCTAEHIQAIIDKTDDLNTLDWPVVLKDAKGAHRAKSQTAMAHGTRVHEAIAFWIDLQGVPTREEVSSYIHDNFTGTEEDIAAAMIGFDAFIQWANSVNLEIVESEQVVSDGEYYAGRFDLLAKVNGVLTLIDIKTSTGIYDEYFLQVGGYAACLVEKPSHISILRIDKITGQIEYQSKDNIDTYATIFKLLAQVYNGIQSIKPIKERKK